MLSVISIFANFYLRLCFRFLAAMRIKLLVFAHPILVTMPALFIWSYALCNYIPICSINTVLHKFGLSVYCLKGVNPTGMLSDYYVTWIWMLSFMLWNYSFINGDPIDPSDEIIETMTPMMSGLDICQSLMVFHWAVNKKVLFVIILSCMKNS